MRIKWGTERPSSSGIDRGVLYLSTGVGVPWNGLVSVDEGGEQIVDSERYFDGMNYALLQSVESCKATLQAFTSPEEFDEYDGWDDFKPHQGRREFGLSWRDTGSEIHILYNCLAAPSRKRFVTKSNSLTVEPIAWDIVTRPIRFDTVTPTAHLVVNIAEAYPSVVSDLEDMLYGSDTTVPYLPTPEEIFEFFEDSSTFFVVDWGDGSWTATGPDEMVEMTDATSFRITSPSAVWNDSESYTVSSY